MSLEKVQLAMVVWIIGYLLLIDLFMVPPKVWWTVIKGFFSFGALPAAESGNIDWLLLGAFAAYAGSGGLGNVGISNYVRDKGLGYEQPRRRNPLSDWGARGDLESYRQSFSDNP